MKIWTPSLLVSAMFLLVNQTVWADPCEELSGKWTGRKYNQDKTACSYTVDASITQIFDTYHINLYLHDPEPRALCDKEANYSMYIYALCDNGKITSEAYYNNGTVTSGLLYLHGYNNDHIDLYKHF